MASKGSPRNAVPVSDLAGGILDPLLRKRAGMSVELVQSWTEIVGEHLSTHTRPERIAWPRRLGEDDPFRPATLVIACDGTAALKLQHEAGEVIARINAFLGFAAIGRIRIVQKPIDGAHDRPIRRQRALTKPEEEHLARLTAQIEDEGLRAALARLGASVLAARK
jgi:hypothetical protein